jgi:hypothetical protein
MSLEISGIGALGFGLMALALYVARVARFASASRRWPTVAGRMLYSHVDQPKGHGAASTHVHYSYVVDGVTFESKRLRFGFYPSSNYGVSVSELRRLQGSGKLRVYYDPRKPSRSCLLAGINELTFMLPFLLLVLSVLFIASDLYISTAMR